MTEPRRVQITFFALLKHAASEDKSVQFRRTKCMKTPGIEQKWMFTLHDITGRRQLERVLIWHVIETTYGERLFGYRALTRIDGQEGIFVTYKQMASMIDDMKQALAARVKVDWRVSETIAEDLYAR